MKYILFSAIALSITLSSFGQDTIVRNTDSVPVQKLGDPSLRTDIGNNQKVSLANTNNEEVYKLKPAVDIPVTAAAMGWSLYAFTKIYSKEKSTTAQILALNKNDINGFDRWAAGKSSDKAAKASDYLFYGSMPLPVVLLFDKDTRKDILKIGFMYLEAMSVTGLLYTGSVYLNDRYRPETYNTSIPVEERRRGGNKNSFFAGHPALVATSTFFVAKVYADYHPESSLRHVLYGVATASTLGTAYLRHRAGKHFPSDLIIGVSVGTLSGILTPHFHKNKIFKDPNLSITPFTGQSSGLALTYRL